MKMISTNCPSCGATLKVDSEMKTVICEHCGSSFMIDDEVQHIQYDNAAEAGYQFEKGRQRAQAEARMRANQTNVTSKGVQKQPVKKKKTWLWVLGWICIFPLPLTILLLRKKDMKPALKYGIIAVAWIIYLIIALSGNSNNDNQQSDVSNAPTESVEQVESSNGTPEIEVQNKDNSDEKNTTINASVIDSFIDVYNSSADKQISDVSEFVVQGENGEHSRTEYRLQAYKNAQGKIGKIDTADIEMVQYRSNFRIYITADTVDDAKLIFGSAVNILNKRITDDDIKKAYEDMDFNTGSYMIENMQYTFLKEGERYEIMIDTKVDDMKLDVSESSNESVQTDEIRDESLNGRGRADEGRSEPQYVNHIGYIALSASQEYDIQKEDNYEAKEPWTVPTYIQDKQFWVETGETIEHKTEVIVREQMLEHGGYGSYSGYLLVERTDNGKQCYIDVVNFITKPYWTYEKDKRTAALTGMFVAEYNQTSDYYPVSQSNEKVELDNGTVVLVKGITGTYGKNGPDHNTNQIEAIVWKEWKLGYGGVSVYFNTDDLTIKY